MLKKTIIIGELFDYYGSLLTERQRNIVADYYFNNFSLGEISERYGVTRQAIYDHLQRAENSMVDFEEKLKLVKRARAVKEGLKNLRELVEDLPQKEKLLQAIAKIVEEYEGV